MVKKIKQIIKKFVSNEKGSSTIIETAVAVPVILGLFMGLVFYANAMRYKVVMNMAAKEGARYYQATKDNGKAVGKAYEELGLGHVSANAKVTGGGIEITKPYGFYIPFFDKHMLNLKSKHDFFEELDHRYYKQEW